jgi:AraC-like DNA-binding protein
MRYSEHPPALALRRFVECIWFLEDDQPNPQRPVERILPDGCMELIVHWRSSFLCRPPGLPAQRQPGSFLVGGLTSFFEVQPPERIGTLGIRFRPAGACAFFRVPMDALTDRVVPLDALCGHDAELFREQVAEARTNRERVRVAEKFLWRLRAATGGRGPDARIECVVREILRTRGQTTVLALSEDAGISGRQLERKFLACAGLGPKVLCRLLRFQSVFREIGPEPAPNWAGIAADSGYFDQAHLIADFKRFAGETPSSLVAGKGLLTSYFTSRERLKALFDPAEWEAIG